MICMGPLYVLGEVRRRGRRRWVGYEVLSDGVPGPVTRIPDDHKDALGRG